MERFRRRRLVPPSQLASPAVAIIELPDTQPHYVNNVHVERQMEISAQISYDRSCHTYEYENALAVRENGVPLGPDTAAWVARDNALAELDASKKALLRAEEAANIESTWTCCLSDLTIMAGF